MISVLNNVSSLVAENALSSTQTSLQSTLQQLSTGVRINSGSNDPAGLSIANGLGANIAALTQSTQNASNGVGLLQTADGALSQVTSLLNQAVSIATEASNGGLTTAQSTAANTQFTSIMSEINQIGLTTNFNGNNVFTGNALASAVAAKAVGSTPIASTGAVVSGLSLTLGNGAVATYTVSATAGADTAATLATDIATLGTGSAGTNTATSGNWTISGTVNGVAATAADFAGITSSTPTTTAAPLSISTSTTSTQASYDQSVTVGGTTTGLGSFTSTAATAAVTTSSQFADAVYTSDGTAGGNASLGTTISALSSTALGLTGNLSTTTGAQAALLQITNAISTVAAQRGTIGANVNQLTATEGVQNTEVQNLTSAQNNVQNADIGTTVAKMTQYNVLEQTGMAAMSQSNQAQQAVLKLLQ